MQKFRVFDCVFFDKGLVLDLLFIFSGFSGNEAGASVVNCLSRFVMLGNDDKLVHFGFV